MPTRSPKRSPGPGSFGPPRPAFATSTCTGPFASAAASNARPTSSSERTSQRAVKAQSSLSGRGERRLVAGEQRERESLTGQPPRDREPDALGAARDDGVPAALAGYQPRVSSSSSGRSDEAEIPTIGSPSPAETRAISSASS